MKKTEFILFIVLIILLILPVSLAQQTTLIVWPPVIYFQGIEEFLNIFWNATYNPPLNEPVGARCWLNCPYNLGDYVTCQAGCGRIEEICAAYQNCSYSGSQGSASCTINNPNYTYGYQADANPNRYEVSDSANLVTCKFFYPKNEDIIFFPYLNATFKTLDYSAAVSDLSYIVGEKIPWKMSIVNLGMMDDNYTVNITNNFPNIVVVEPLKLNTSTIANKQIASVHPNMLLLSAASSTLQVFITSNKDTFACTEDANCSALVGGICNTQLGKCGISMQVIIKSGLNSLPEFDIYGLVMIFFVAAIVFSLIVLKKRKFRK